jgi:transposase
VNVFPCLGDPRWYQGRVPISRSTDAASLLRELEELRARVAQLEAAQASAHAARESADAARELAERSRESADAARELAERKVEMLQRANALLAMRLYGRRSEKLSRKDLAQLMLALGASERESRLPDPLIPVPEVTEAEPDDTAPDARRSKRRVRRRSTTIEDRVERSVEALTPVPASERACRHCGEEMQSFGVVEHRHLEFVPAKFIVHVEQREKLACKQRGCPGEAVTAERRAERDMPLRVGATVLAELVEAKCDDALPIHRQCDRFRRLGVDFPESTLYGYWRYATTQLVPLAEALLGVVMEDPNWVGVDDTRLDVLDPTAKGGKYRGHLWCFRASSGLVAYQFTKTWEAQEVAQWLALRGETTYLQVDDYKGYSSTFEFEARKLPVVPAELRLGCMMHVRRRFKKALDLGDTRAAKPVEWIRELYRVEERARGQPPDVRLDLRKRESLPILSTFEAWCDAIQPGLGKSDPLSRAVDYAVNQRVFVHRCFTDGRFEIDNGAVEREIREAAIGRKNYLFTGSYDAGCRLAAAYTLVQTCRRLGLNSREYLIDVLTKVERGWPARRLTDLLPHRWSSAND